MTIADWERFMEMPQLVREEVVAAPETAELVAQACAAFQGHLEGLIMHGDWVKGRAGRGTPVEVACVVNGSRALWQSVKVASSWKFHLDNPPQWRGRQLKLRTVRLGEPVGTPYLWYEVASGEGIVLYDKSGLVGNYLQSLKEQIGRKEIERFVVQGDVFWRIDEDAD